MKKATAKKTAAKKTAAKKAAVTKPSVEKAEGATAKPTKAESAVTTLAQECLNGTWGTGRDRDELLKKAGHHPEAVRKEVYRLRGEQSSNQP